MVVAAEALFRSALVLALDDIPEFRVVGACDSVGDVLKAAPLGADIVLADLGLTDQAALQLCNSLSSSGSPTKVVVIDGTADVDRLLTALSAGAAGYVTRSGHMTELVAAIRDVAMGEMAIPQRMLGALLRELIRHRREENVARTRLKRLSQREQQVLALLTTGHDHADIASQLVISAQTARTHIQNVLSKLEVHSRVEAVALAAEHGFLQPDRGELT